MNMNWFQKLRRYIIIKTAESYYEKMSRQCNELYKQTHKHHYIIIDPWLGKKIVITNRDNFRAIKRAINDSGARMAVRSGKLPVFTNSTMPDVHNGCFYSSLLQTTLNKVIRNNNEWAIKTLQNEIEKRKQAYIKWTLEHAKIRQHKTRQQRREERIVKRELKAIRKGNKA